MKARVLVLGILGPLSMILTGCGTSLNGIVGSTSSTGPQPISSGQGATPTTAPLRGEVAVAFPVVACTSISGGSLGSQGWRPTFLLAPIPTALVGKVEFYSDGVHTVVAPTGWTCAQSVTSATGRGLAVYPTSTSIPPVFGPPAPGTEGVFAIFDTTGHPAGVALVCPFFAVLSFQKREANCSSVRPASELVNMPTPEVATVLDGAGAVGSLPASGGSNVVAGVVIFPQVMPAVITGSSVSVAEESCSLPDTSLCATILSDFEVREFPMPASAATSSSLTTTPTTVHSTPTTAPAAPPTTAPTPTPTPTTAAATTSP